ncbi:MAG: hypothetical protein ACE5WD_01670 [Candidatus Aminicenantia bacterium]
MKTFLIVIASVLGFFSLLIGGLIFLWFYQGGCCVKKIKSKFNKKINVKPIIKEE